MFNYFEYSNCCYNNDYKKILPGDNRFHSKKMFSLHIKTVNNITVFLYYNKKKSSINISFRFDRKTIYRKIYKLSDIDENIIKNIFSLLRKEKLNYVMR